MDFTFIKKEQSFLCHDNYYGALEVKRNEFPNSSNRSSNSSNKESVRNSKILDGMNQAFSRAIAIVFYRFEVNNYTGNYNAYCMYANGTHLGVAIASIIDLELKFYIIEPMALPMCADYEDSKALKPIQLLLLFLRGEAPDTLLTPGGGLPEVVTNGKDSWKLGNCIGFGGFSVVYSTAIESVEAANDNHDCIIKICRASALKTLLAQEHNALKKLRLKLFDIFTYYI
jgi:hypothetical protein